MWSNETPRTAPPPSAGTAGCPPESAAGHLLLVTPGADPFVVSTLRQAAERSLAQGAAEAASDTSPARSKRSIRLRGRKCSSSSALPSGGRTVRPLPTTCATVSSSSPTRRARGKVALELGRALWFTDRIADALAVLGKALDEIDRERDPDLYELLVAELISSAWWDAHTYPIAEAAIHGLDLDALHGGLGGEILLATMAHYEPAGAAPERAVELARRALAGPVGERFGRVLLRGEFAAPGGVARAKRFPVFDPAPRSGSEARRRLQRRFHVDGARLLSDASRRSSSSARGFKEAIDLCVAHGMPVAWPYNIGFLAHALLEQGETGHAAR